MNAIFAIGLLWLFLEFVCPKMTRDNVALTPECALVVPWLAKLYAVLTVCLASGGLAICALLLVSAVHGAPVTEMTAENASTFFLKEVASLEVMLTAALCISAQVAGAIIRVTNWKWAAFASFPIAVLMAAHSTLQFVAG